MTLTNLKNAKFLMGVSLLSLTVGAPALAQSTAPVQGGEVVVEQEDATVDVQVPDPDVEVTQGQPVVTVDQPQPEITVQVPEPTVRVQQQAPIITVTQAQPQITVVIPEPTVTIEVPNPQVDVDTGEPVVNVDQPDPVVRFVRPEPKISVESSEPNIQIENADPTVNVAAAQDPEVNVQQEKAQINVEQSDDANVVVEDAADPEVNVEQAAQAADVKVTQEDARVVLEDFNADEQGNMQDEDRQRYNETVSVLPIFEMTTDDLVGQTVVGENGENVGDIDNIGVRGNTVVAIVGVGGFLGMGETEVAVPVSQMVFENNQVIVPGVTKERLEALPEYNDTEVRILEPGVRLADELNMD